MNIKKIISLILLLCLVIGTQANPSRPMVHLFNLKAQHKTSLATTPLYRSSLSEEYSFIFFDKVPKGWTSTPAPKGFETSDYSRGAQYTSNATISTPGAKDVTKVVIHCSCNVANKNTIAVTVGGQALGSMVTLDKANNVELTFSGNALNGDIVIAITRKEKSVYIKQVVVTGSLDIKPEKDTLQLDPTWQYTEPTVFMPKDSIGSSTRYAFVDQNVRISCTAGARYADYIGCNASASMTFTTTKALKGIRINGYVKKGFSATATKGDITYVDATDNEVTADPVLLIKNINDTTVTIRCDKQLRCYNIAFYFEANPTDTIDQPGGIKELSEMNAIEIDYYPSYSQVGAYNYSVILFDHSTSDTYYPAIAFDIFTPNEKSYSGTYSTDSSNMGRYNYFQLSEEEYYMLESASLTITDNENGTYTVSGIASDGETICLFDVTASAEYYNAEYPYEPEQVTTIALCTIPGVEDASYISYGEITIEMDMGDEWAALTYMVPQTASYNWIPDGTYPIEPIEYDEYDLPVEQDYGYFAAGEFYADYLVPIYSYYMTEDATWYLQSGSATINTTADGCLLTLQAISYYGSTISATVQLTSPAGTDNLPTSTTPNIKQLRNGQLVIQRGGQLFTPLGSLIQ